MYGPILNCLCEKKLCIGFKVLFGSFYNWGNIKKQLKTTWENYMHKTKQKTKQQNINEIVLAPKCLQSLLGGLL